uniref:Aminoglycoside phosphotransferase domain-containing protein n=1 Tax=viral metagenome TaxID=1070528 RepID=A0A6C0HWX7_9ZZZZ
MKTRIRRNKKTRNKKRTRNRKGGVLFFQTAVQDIMPELHRFLSGKQEVVGDGRHGVILRFTADESTMLRSEKCGLKHILVKVVAIDQNAKIQGYSIDKISVLEFEEEVHIHQDICEASVKEFSCSIAPTLLYAQIYTLTELDQFPALKLKINTTGRIGLIFMEMIKADKDDYPAFNLYDYYIMPTNKQFVLNLFPTMRRILIMLAQLGFLHNDFHLRNFVCQETPLVIYIIDFGRATRMTEEQKIEFNGYLEANDVEKIITFLYGKNKSYINDNHTKFLYYQWLNQPQIDTVVPGIDLSIKFAPQESIVAPIRFAQEQQAFCVFPPKIPYGEIDRPERERIMREKEAEAERIRKKIEDGIEEVRKLGEKRLADEKAAALAKETPEEKALREEKETAEQATREKEAEKLRSLDPNSS